MTRAALRLILGLAYAFAGYLHLVAPDQFMAIMPPAIPAPKAVVIATGIAELAGAAGLLQPFSASLRKATCIGLALYALCVWPANIYHLLRDLGFVSGGPITHLGAAYHWPRMPLQLVLIWLALWVGGATDWPFAKRSPRM